MLLRRDSEQKLFTELLAQSKAKPPPRRRHIHASSRWKTMTSCLTSSSGDTSCTCCPRASTAYRHYGLFANGDRAANIARARELLVAEPRITEPKEDMAAAPHEPDILPCHLPNLDYAYIALWARA